MDQVSLILNGVSLNENTSYSLGEKRHGLSSPVRDGESYDLLTFLNATSF